MQLVKLAYTHCFMHATVISGLQLLFYSNTPTLYTCNSDFKATL